MFLLFAALWLGENAHVLSNDLFSDIKGDLCDNSGNYDLKPIFDKWVRSAMVRRNGGIDFGDVKILVSFFNK